MCAAQALCTAVFAALRHNWLPAAAWLLQDESGQPMINQLFGVKLQTKLKCEETGEEYTVGVPESRTDRQAGSGSGGCGSSNNTRGPLLRGLQPLELGLGVICTAAYRQPVLLLSPATVVGHIGATTLVPLWCLLASAAGGQHRLFPEVQHQPRRQLLAPGHPAGAG